MDDFSFRELECFLATAEELSFTRAAERLHLAQPPLSRHIRNLEEKLGVVLFERTKRKVTLTVGGEAFREEARDILTRVRRAGEAARRASAGETDRLGIGFVSAVLSPELVEVFTRFRRRSPGVRLDLRDRLPADQMALLEREELDLGFVGVAPEKCPSGIELVEWREEPLMAFFPAGHELAGAERVRWEDLAEEAFVMISAEAAPAYTAHVRRLCHEVGFRPRVVQEARRAQAVAAMTVAGSGVSVLPESLHRITGNGAPLFEGRNRRSRITHVVAHHARASEATLEFLELLRR